MTSTHDIADIPRRALILALAVLTAEALWVLWAVVARQQLWLPVTVFVASAVPVLAAMVLRGGAAKVFGALARSALAVAAGDLIGVPVYVVWIKHVSWVTAWQDWSPGIHRRPYSWGAPSGPGEAPGAPNVTR